MTRPHPIEDHWDGPEPDTVAGILRHHFRRTPDRLAYRFLTGPRGDSESWTYRDLDLRARAIGGRLQREGLRNRPVLLLLPPGLEYVAGFLGCLYAGAIAVPAYPPDTGRTGATTARLAAVARNTQARWALVDEEQKHSLESGAASRGDLGTTDLRWLASTECGQDDADAWHDPEATPGSLAFLQYTSGSTAMPKGVMVSNENLVANLRTIHLTLEHDRDSALVSWLPPYHDMGLVGGLLTPLYGGIPGHLMAPRTFIQRPLLWLETLSSTRATTSPSPNFGFDYCLSRISEEQAAELDLGSWRHALNGAEPVRADTLDRFAERFARCGFDRRALLPCYGLAEATLLVSGTPADRAPRIASLDAEALENARVETAVAGRRTVRVVGCGPAADRVDVAIVDPATRRRQPAGRVGEIWISGPGVARGYWRNPDATRETFQARIVDDPDGTEHLRTGDLGFERDGELHIVGRLKDVVIVQGRNHYPQDVELTVERVDEAIRGGCGAAFGIDVDGAEEMVVVYEVNGPRVDDPGTLLARIRAAIAREHEVSPHAVVLVRRGSVGKTTSGKIQRRGCREAFLTFALPVVAASVTQETGTGHGSADRTRLLETIRSAVPGTTTASPDLDGRDFADIGLTYTGLLDLANHLNRELDLRVPLGDLLAEPSVPALLSLLGDDDADAATRPSQSATEIEEWLVEKVAARLGLPAGAIDTTVPFAELGLASKAAVGIIDELGTWLGRALPSSTVFERPTIRDVAHRLGGEHDEHTLPTPKPEPDDAAEPIAVVGLGCRFPGASDPDGYWRLLLDGRDAVTDVPPGRWDVTGVEAPNRGGFLDQIDRFDARFFGISAREAERMDPQQRLLLEIAWETFEDAGIAPDAVAGTDTGVFVGISSHDYADLQTSDHRSIDVYAATGTAHAVAANRLSYQFDLRGPSLAIDTACSSSLVAVHAACRSLRAGECDMALAGGVNLIINPALSVAFARGGMLSPDGTCRTFDDAASGYVRGEGAGLVCLKRLSRALADGDRILATITGAAVGHGGRANGLTAPKGSAQRQVIEQALAEAGTDAREIDYVEAHGTGTVLGDPIEWEALTEVYGRDRAADSPCPVGSVKANIGHLEAAAGIAGLIKAVLTVWHGELPPQLHFTTPNRHLPWDGSGLTVLTERDGRVRVPPSRVAVSSFGFGGANAHVIVGRPPEARPTTTTPGADRPVQALSLSAHTPSALASLARRYRAHIAARPDVELADLCHAANTGRAALGHRAAVVTQSMSDLDQALTALAAGEASADVIRGERTGRAPKAAFLFSGQGTQYPGMGRGLYESSQVYAAVIDQADDVLRPLLNASLRDLLFTGDDPTELKRTRNCQPALVAVEVALARLWGALGVRPVAVLGHSVGAFAAACVAGALSLEDALTLAATRGRLMDELPGAGAMIACAGEPEPIQAAAAARPAVTVAAVNARNHLVLSGPLDEIDELARDLPDKGIVVRRLAVSHAFHSPLMAGAADPLRDAAHNVAAREPEMPWISDHTGEPMGRPDPGYWADHLLGTVRFADGLATLRRLGCDTFVEAGPHPTLLGLARTGLAGDAESALWLPSLRRKADDWQTFLRSVGRWYCAGGDVRWAGLDADRPRRRVAVPHAVFERGTYWLKTPWSTSGNGTAEPRREPDMDGNGYAHPTPTPQTTTSGDGAARVLAYMSKVCGFPVDQISPHARVGSELGFDSLMKGELERHLAPLYPDRVAGLRHTLPEDFTVGQLLDALGLTAAPQPAMTAPPAHTYTPAPAAIPAPAPAPAPDTSRTVKVQRRFEDWEEYAAMLERLRLIEASGPNAYERVHEGFNSGLIQMNGRQMVNFSAFNYLALSAHPRLRAAAKAAIDRYGTSSSATPLLCGETPLHHELEAEIAGFLGAEAAIVFAGGHATNVATVGHLFGPEDIIVHDEWIHDSTVRGCILSGALRRPFPHNDWQALDRVLTATRGRFRRALVVIEGAYSQDGDLPDLPRFIEVKRRHDAMLMIDEAHSLGVLGRTGRGVGEHFGVNPNEVDLWMGTLSKAIGSLGGYIAARRELIRFMKFTTPLYIFSTGISPANAAAALEAFRVIQEEPDRVARLRDLAEHFRTAARARGLDTGVSRDTAVIPIIVGDWARAMEISAALLERGVNVMPIGHPAVPADKCRLRFFVNADHREADLDRSLDLLVDVMDNTSPRHRPHQQSTSDSATVPPPRATFQTRERDRPATEPPPSGTADVLVAGATGFIGGHLTRRLVEIGHRVRVLVREGGDRSAFADLPVEIEHGSLTDLNALLRATSGVRYVYNCAGKSADWGPWTEFEQTNVTGCKNLMDAAHHAGTVERFVHLSTTDVYGYPVRPCDERTEPKDVGLPYNRSKLLGEKAVIRAAEQAGVPLTVIRPVSVYGPGSKDFVVEIAALLKSRQMVYVRRGKAPAGLLYVANLVDGMITACGSERAAGGVYNLRDPEMTTWREYIEALADGLGVKPPSVSLPRPLATGVAGAAERVYGTLRVKSRPVLTRHAVHLLERDQSFPIDRAREDFGFKAAVSFEEGMARTVEWLRSPAGRELLGG